MFKNKRVAFIGAGNMAEAVMRGLLAQGLVERGQVIASDITDARLATIRDRYGVGVPSDNTTAVDGADVIVLCVKPQIYPKVAPYLQTHIKEDALIVSVMAGVTIETMATSLQHAAVVRSMPNTPAMIGKGMVVWTKTEAVTEAQAAQAQAIFSALGSEAFVDDEKYLDMATAMSGSGPAYVFLFMEAWIDAGVKMGFSRAIAEQLVRQTVLGSAEYWQQSDTHITQLRNQVTSPGGTTAAGLHQMESHNLRTAVAEGVFAAYQQAVALGKK